MRRMEIVSILALSVFFVTGCGVSLVPVSGTVTLNGEPAANLQVTFEPLDSSLGAAGMGFTKADGKYELHYPGSQKGAPAGDYVVRITPMETDDPEAPTVEIPARYNTQSELKVTVEAGKTYDFPLIALE
jgi:hypothetical protein